MPKFFHIDTKAIQTIWPEFRFRDEQMQMAKFIQSRMNNDEISLIEAGTGVGKTLAYLLPLLEYLKNTEGRVLISTETRALQEQIIERDLPMAQKIYSTDFKAEICMGARNYICKRRLNENLLEGKISPAMSRILPDFVSLESESSVGMHSEFKDVMTHDFWERIKRDKDDCLTNQCPNFSESYYFLAKENWKSAQILIVNHSLLASHYVYNEKLLPEVDCIVIDEAHGFADIFHRSFSNQSSWLELQHLVYALGQGYGDLLKAVENFRREVLDNIQNPAQSRIRITVPVKLASLELLIKALVKAENKQNDLIEEAKSQIELGFLEDENLQKSVAEMRLRARLNKLYEHRQIFESFLAGPKEKEIVHWLELKIDKDNKSLFPIFNSSPIDSGELVFENFFSTMQKVVLTSATLCTSKQNPFLYASNHLGLHEKRNAFASLKLNSPFDYKKNALLYLPKNMPDPASNNASDEQKRINEILLLLQLSRGGAFVLFTSRYSLQNAATELRNKLKNVNILSQLDAGGAAAALSGFRQDSNSVLLGLATFWQGVDVPGDHLRMVIIVKLPFRVPDEPILAAQMHALKEQGKNPFMEVQLPQAIISIKQGFGRLIRSEKDRGVVAILDPRIITRRYGSVILESLPEAKKIHDFQTLQNKYNELFV